MGEVRVVWTVEVYEHDINVISRPLASGRGSTSDEAKESLKKTVRDKIGVYAGIPEASVR